MPSDKFVYDSDGEFITSGGVRLSDVPEHVKHEVEWMDGLHGSAQDDLPSEAEVATPAVLSSLPTLHPLRPRGATPMIDAHGAGQRLKHCRPGAWLISPRTGYKWAKWPNGEISWCPKEVELPNALRVSNRNDLQ